MLMVRLLFFTTLTIGFSHSDSVEIIGLSSSFLQKVTNPCFGHRCDTSACPCGCECGTASDSGLCYVPQKRTVSYNQTTTSTTSNGILVATPKPPNAIVSINTATTPPNITILHSFPANFLSIETAYDPSKQIYWMLTNSGSSLLGYDVKQRRLTPEIDLDITNCTQGSGCFNELRYDTHNNRIVAVGMGFGGPQNAIVAINLDKSPGAVTQISPAISRDCALYLQCSSIDSQGQMFYPWFACDDSPTAALFAINMSSGTNTTLLDVSFRDVLGPSVFVNGIGVVAVAPDNSLVSAIGNNKTKPISATLGSIPADNGLVADQNGKTWVSLVDMSKSKLAQIDLTSGDIALSNLPYIINNPAFVSDGDER
tara:strand:+ start:64 stop:1170 length:1107 start_codon:yes stop_codon:yes gene_type:complete